MKTNYILTECDSDVVFAVISAETKAIEIELVALAIKEEFTYEKVTFRSDSYSSRSGTVFMSFDCFSEGDSEDEGDLKEIELNLTAIYSSNDIKLTDEKKLKHHIRFRNEMGILGIIGILGLILFLYFNQNNLRNNLGIIGIGSAQILTILFFFFKAIFKINKIKANGTT